MTDTIKTLILSGIDVQTATRPRRFMKFVSAGWVQASSCFHMAALIYSVQKTASSTFKTELLRRQTESGFTLTPPGIITNSDAPELADWAARQH